jgi:hypothetical protein
MKKGMLIIAVLLSIGVQTGKGAEFNGKVLFRVNGHHYLIDDVVGKYMLQQWDAHRESFREEFPLPESWKFRLGKIKKLRFRTVSSSPDRIKLKINIDKSTFIVPIINLKGYLDMDDVIITFKKEFDRDGWKLVSDVVEVGDFDVVWDNNGLWIINDILDAAMNLVTAVFLEFPMWIAERFEGYLFRTPFGKLEFPILPMNVFVESGHGIVVADTTAEIEAVINSFPVNISFDYSNTAYVQNIVTGAHVNYDGLIINIQLMPGYGDNLTLYLNGSPPLPTQPTLEYAGFAMKSDNYSVIDINNTMTWREEVQEVHRIIKNELGLTDVRIDALWKWVVGTVPEINPDNIPGFPNIDSADVDNYIQQIAENTGPIGGHHAGWTWLDYVINNADSMGLRPVVIIGEALVNKTPLYEVSPGVFKHIVPGTPRGVYADTSIGVSEEVYKYWLELYARAVVRRYKDRVDFWEAEGELNAARFTESFDWWRVGSAWHDDTPGGFQDQVAELLYTIVHDEDDVISNVSNSPAKVVQAFHMFDMARRIDQWQNYYDIAGIHLYPNIKFAYPVLGFMVGEMVYSTRRALHALGLDKPVWVLENMYPVINPEFLAGQVEADPDTMQDYYQFLTYRTTQRQKQFIKEAIQTSAKYGAEVYNYFRPITSYQHNPNQGSGATYSYVNHYGGLIRANDSNLTLTYLPAFDVYHDEFDDTSPLDWVTLRTRYLDIEDLEGTLSVKGVIEGVTSGESRRLYETVEYTAIADEEWLLRPSNQEPVKHLNWNDDDQEFKLEHQFTPNTPITKEQTAIYNNQSPVYFATSVTDENLVKRIKIKDPWYVTAAKTQPNEFVALDTNVYSVFLDQYPDQGPAYRLRAPRLYATTDAIYEFSGWTGTNVTFGDASSRETDVVFLDGTTRSVQANYDVQVNNQAGTSLIPEDDELVIPNGADIAFKSTADYYLDTLEAQNSIFPEGEAFALVVEGDLVIGSNAVLRGDGNGLWRGITAAPTAAISVGNAVIQDAYRGIQLEGNGHHPDEEGYLQLDHTLLADNFVGLYYVYSFSDCRYGTFHTVINNGTFVDNEFSVYLNAPGGTNHCVMPDSGGFTFTFTNNIVENSDFVALGADVFQYNWVNNSALDTLFIGVDPTNYLNQGPPLFSDPANGDYTLQCASPCIDAGDPDSPPDPDGTVADLGAYPRYQTPAYSIPFSNRSLTTGANLGGTLAVVGQSVPECTAPVDTAVTSTRALNLYGLGRSYHAQERIDNS